VHEAGHIIGGRHEIDEYGDDGESATSHRCKMLGAVEVGFEGPSVMSYAVETDWPGTLCFAYPTDTGTPKKNLTYVGEYLEGNLY
jgi:hypothetical protein